MFYFMNVVLNRSYSFVSGGLDAAFEVELHVVIHVWNGIIYNKRTFYSLYILELFNSYVLFYVHIKGVFHSRPSFL